MRNGTWRTAYPCEVDNFPGYPEGVDGPAMMVDLQKQAERFGTEVYIGTATAVELSNEGGAHKVPSTTRYWKLQRLLYYGSICKVSCRWRTKTLWRWCFCMCGLRWIFLQGQEVAIVGGGDTAAEEATTWQLFVKVTVLVRKDHMRASKPCSTVLPQRTLIYVMMRLMRFLAVKWSRP